MKYISSGGLGDYFIVSLKMQEKYRKDDEIDWLHVESNDIISATEAIDKLFKFSCKRRQIIWDKSYVDSLQRFGMTARYMGEERWAVPTPVTGRCDFYKFEEELRNPFLEVSLESDEKYDIVIQCSAGVNNDRNWKDLRTTILVLMSTGRKVTLIGSDSFYRDIGIKGLDNKVGETSLLEAFQIIQNCKVYIGMSGLLNYFACASKVNNLHVVESQEHERKYYHEKWLKYTTPLKIGAPTEIIHAVRKLA